jgi:hypothetical protein
MVGIEDTTGPGHKPGFVVYTAIKALLYRRLPKKTDPPCWNSGFCSVTKGASPCDEREANEPDRLNPEGSRARECVRSRSFLQSLLPSRLPAK